MERKTWVKPMTLVQKFEANEPVAAESCWKISCDWRGTINHLGECGKESAFDYQDTDGDGKIDYVRYDDMWGIGTAWYELQFYKRIGADDYPEDPIATEDIKVGDEIYWRVLTTNHYAKVQASDPNHPNHS